MTYKNEKVIAKKKANEDKKVSENKEMGISNLKEFDENGDLETIKLNECMQNLKIIDSDQEIYPREEISNRLDYQ